MNSLDESCTPLKVQYDNCFNSWFKEVFLKCKGAEKNHDEACGNFFKLYQACLTGALEKHNISKQELYKDILGTEKEKRT